ncbi:helix-turn-helix domain-containing protein [Pseudomonas aeruginosa]|uniref:helix-turn-helix domain-containing protein n=1 Tax=Pseudomonas aeruginosa TaxID=287 RepID=UPI001E64E0FB|nr:helix-turn-helix domain-containing protein [Pseudomonas aeruginosa]
MSTIIMSACWPLQGLTPAQKAVLISLADNANDEGVCWPSVAKIAERTCLSERAVQQAIKVLNECKALSIEARQGRSTMFTVTPAAFAPPQKVHPRRKCTPAANAPHPRRCCTQNRNRTIRRTIRRTVTFADPFRAGGWRRAAGGLPECVGSVPGSLRGALGCSAGAKRQGQFPGEATGGRSR